MTGFISVTGYIDCLDYKLQIDKIIIYMGYSVYIAVLKTTIIGHSHIEYIVVKIKQP